MDPRRRLTMVNILSHDWLCGRVDVPATPLMTPDILDMSGSHVGTALRVAMNAYHKAARAGFTLMDVSNAPLAKRRKRKNFSSESQKGSDDSTDMSSSKPDTQTVSKKDTMTVPERGGDSEKKSSIESSTHGNIPALAVCLSPSLNKQSVIDTVVTSREPPPLRPISSDYECLLSGNSSSSTETNFFFKEFYDSSSALAYSRRSHNQLSSSSSSISGNVLRHYTNKPDLTGQEDRDSVFNQKHPIVHRGPVDTGEGCIPTQGPDGKVLVQRGHGKSQYTCSTTKQSRTNDSDVMNNNILDIALSGLREGNRSRKRQYPP